MPAHRRVDSASSSDNSVRSSTSQNLSAEFVENTQEDEPAPRTRGSTRASACKASKAWEDLVPKSRRKNLNAVPPKNQHKRSPSTTASKASKPKSKAAYALPDIPLASSDEEEVGSASKTAKPATGKNLPSSSHRTESKSRSETRAGKSRAKASVNDSESEVEGKEDEDVDEDEGEDEDDSSSETGSESSGLRELERKNPGAVEAKFADEAATWVDGEPDDAPDDNELAIDTLPTYLSSVKSPETSPRGSSTGMLTPTRSPIRRTSNHSRSPSLARSPVGSHIFSPLPGSPMPSRARSIQFSPTHSPTSTHGPPRASIRSSARAPPVRSSSRIEANLSPPPTLSYKRYRSGVDSSQSSGDEGPMRPPKKRTGGEFALEHDEQRRRKQEKERKQKKERERELEREGERENMREQKRKREQEKAHERERQARKHEREKAREHAKAREREKVRERELEKARKRELRGEEQGNEVRSDRKKRATSEGNNTRDKHDANLRDNSTVQKSQSKRKRQDEDISWVTVPGRDDSKPSRSRKRRNIDDSDDSDLASDCDDKDQRIDIVSARGPRPNLGDQYPRVYRVAVRAIKEVEMNIGTVNAFPEGEADGREYLRHILIKHATTLKYKEMVKRLRDEKNKKYWRKFASIPAQRVSLLRGKVKKLCEGIVRGTYGLTVGDSAKVTWLLQGIAYTFPHDYKAQSVVRNKPFGLAIFEDMLQAAFFSKRASYGYRVSHLFTSSLPGQPDEKEIPAAMLALVSTAIYAAIDDFKYNRYDTQKFEANTFIQAYRKNMHNLSEIKCKNAAAYHNLMHGLYLRVTASAGSSEAVDAMDYLDVDGMM